MNDLFGFKIDLSTISSLAGWGYVICWGIFNYPQIWSQHVRGSVAGLHSEWIWANTMPFVSYSIYCWLLYYSDDVREDWRARKGSYPDVELNDVFFSFHGTFTGLILAWQLFRYRHTLLPQGRMERSRRWIYWAMHAVLVGSFPLAYAGWMPLWLFLAIQGNTKGIMTYFKYQPQTALNARRKSTRGQSFVAVLFDTAGGCLSILQQVVDAIIRTGSPIAVTQNPAKLFNSIVSLSFCCVFIYQAFAFYGQGPPEEEKKNETV